MSKSASELYDDKLKEIIPNIPTDLESNETTTAIKNFETFVKSRPENDASEPDPAPKTRWERIIRAIGKALDNETTRTLIKAGGTFAGVAIVVHSTIHRDHVLERTALNQANQSPR